MPTAQTKVPKYSIDRNDFTRETGIFRPSELCVKIELQELTSAREIDLDITEQNLELKQLFFGKDLEGVGYALSLSLPCPVLCYQGSAKFDMAERVLTVTIPVADAAIPTGAKPAMKAPKYSIERSPPIDPVAIRQSRACRDYKQRHGIVRRCNGTFSVQLFEDGMHGYLRDGIQ